MLIELLRIVKPKLDKPDPTIRELLSKFGLLGFTRSSKFFLLLVITFGIKCFFSIFVNDRNLLFIFGDATLLIKKRKHFLASLVIGMLCSIKLILMLNFATKKQLKWLELFDIFESNTKLPNTIISPDVLKKIKLRLKWYKKLMSLNVKAIPISFMILFIELIVIAPNMFLKIINVFWFVYHTALAYYLAALPCLVIMPLEIISFFIMQRVLELNQLLDKKFKTWFKLQEVKSALKSHIDISTSIAVYNIFFKKIYLMQIIVGIPLTLIWVHLLLFSEINVKFKAFIATSLVCIFIGIFHLQFNAAKISAFYRKSYVKLCKLQWGTTALGETTISLKFKVNKNF